MSLVTLASFYTEVEPYFQSSVCDHSVYRVVGVVLTRTAVDDFD